MSQQSNDDLARALEGLGDTKPKPAAAPHARPPGTIPKIKIQQVPAKPAAAPARPAQPQVRPVQARPGQPNDKPTTQPRPMVRAAGGASSVPAAKAVRSASPLDAPAALASAMESTPSTVRVAKKSPSNGNTLARTVIPILLTLGFILVTLCVVRFQWKSIDNPTSDISPKGAWLIGAFGVVLWGLAAFLMASVARQLRESGVILPEAVASPAPVSPKRPSRAANPD